MATNRSPWRRMLWWWKSPWTSQSAPPPISANSVRASGTSSLPSRSAVSSQRCDLRRDRPERRSGGQPQPGADLDRDRGRAVVLELRDVRPRNGALQQQRAVGRVAAQDANRGAPVPALERLTVVERLVVALPRDLEHGVVAHRRGERVVRHRERFAELQPPLGGDALRGRARLRQVDRHYTVARGSRWSSRIERAMTSRWISLVPS